MTERNPDTLNLVAAAAVVGVVLWVYYKAKKAAENPLEAARGAAEAIGGQLPSWLPYRFQCEMDANNFVAAYKDGWMVVINGFAIKEIGWWGGIHVYRDLSEAEASYNLRRGCGYIIPGVL